MYFRGPEGDGLVKGKRVFDIGHNVVLLRLAGYIGWRAKTSKAVSGGPSRTVSPMLNTLFVGIRFGVCGGIEGSITDCTPFSCKVINFILP